MTEPAARLTLVTPPLDEPGAFPLALAEACDAGDVAAVILRLAVADERTLVRRVKALAPAAQERGAAVVVSVEGENGGLDLAAVAIRGGADGVHAVGSQALGELRGKLKGERILGIGRLRSKDDAMTAGESGADYLLFGEPRPDGSLPPLEAVIERAAWWAEIFETPCVAYAPAIEDVPALGATGAEFVAAGPLVFDHADGPAAGVRAVLARLAGTGRAP